MSKGRLWAAKKRVWIQGPGSSLKISSSSLQPSNLRFPRHRLRCLLLGAAMRRGVAAATCARPSQSRKSSIEAQKWKDVPRAAARSPAMSTVHLLLKHKKGHTATPWKPSTLFLRAFRQAKRKSRKPFPPQAIGRPAQCYPPGKG